MCSSRVLTYISSLVMVSNAEDFLCSGQRGDLQWMSDAMSTEYGLKKQLISHSNEQETTYRNRRLALTEKGMRLQGDAQHVDISLEEWALESDKGLATPSTKKVPVLWETDSRWELVKEQSETGQCPYQLHGPRSTRFGSRLATRERYCDRDSGGSEQEHQIHENISQARSFLLSTTSTRSYTRLTVSGLDMHHLGRG